MLKFQKLLSDNNLTYDSDVLDPAFVTKAKDFEANLAKKALTEDQINQIDDELVGMFNQLEISEEDGPELAATKRKAAISEAKEEIAAAETLDQLKALQTKFINLAELDTFIEKRIEKIQKSNEIEKQRLFMQGVSEELKATLYDQLEGLKEKYKGYPDILTAIDKRIVEEKPEPGEKSIREKIQDAKKRRWTFDELSAIGVKPTGDDMEVQGIYLKRLYLFKVYDIIRVDGKDV